MRGGRGRKAEVVVYTKGRRGVEKNDKEYRERRKNKKSKNKFI